jgi:diguanylate cyclase (GGDEF)-like protein
MVHARTAADSPRVRPSSKPSETSAAPPTVSTRTFPRLTAVLARSSGAPGASVLALAGVPVWVLLLVVGVLVAPLYLTLSDTDRDTAYAALACMTPIVIAIAIAHYRPRHQVWTLVALGAALMAAGELAWIGDAAGIGGGTLADPLYLLGYVPLCAAMAGTARRQGAGIGPALDAAILSVAAAAVMWFLVIGPALADSSLTLPAAAVAVAYPVADLVVLGFLLRVLLDRPRATPALGLFALGVTTFLVADIAYSVLVAQGAYTSGAIDLGWMAGYLLWAAAACHPSMTVMRARGHTETHISNRRLVALAVAATVPLVVAAVDQLRDSDVDPLPAVLASVVMFLLVVARLTDLVRDQRALIDERARMQAELERLSMEDPLTGLVNRRGFGARLDGSLGGDAPAAVMLLDLDDFKQVNDTLGHAAGDAVLAAVGRRLRASVRGRDTVARLGGDEFAVLMSDASGPEAAITLGERLLEDIREPIPVGDTQVRVGASLGIAMATPSAGDADTLMRNADLALYRAKEATGHRIEVYDDELLQESVRSLTIRSGLAGAVERGELLLEYQPIVDPVSSRPVAVEALVRWEHPELGVVPLAELMHRAESSGVMSTIGAWILDQACRDARDWRTPAGPLRINLDLAIAQLRDEGLVDVVRCALERNGIAPGRVVLELTEAMLELTPELRPRLVALGDLGIALALDDFGAGYASLARVAALPVRELKIDHSLIGADRRLLGAVRQFGASLGVRVVMQGVRDRVELELVEPLGFDGVQGPAVAGPMRVAALTRYLERHQQPSGARQEWRPALDRGML